MPDKGDITLNGKPYRIDFNTWRGKDVVDFSPRASVPGGSFTMSDLGLFQPLVQSDWRHGFGFHWYQDALGYLSTEGNVDTRHDGLAMLFTAYQEPTESNHTLKYGLTEFNGNIYSWGEGGLRKFNGTAWSSIYNTTAVNFAVAAGSYLFFCPTGARIKKMDTSDVVTDAGLDANASSYQWLIIHNGYIYAGKENSNAIHYDNSETLATLEGTSSDTNRILVGLGASPTLGAEVYNGNLYIRKRDGIWHLGEDRIARRVLDFSAEASDSNLRSVAVINGFYVFALRDRILQWNGARVSDITPHKINDTFPYTTYGRFDNFVAVGDYLYITARTNETVYRESLLAWDGVGWHRLTDFLTNGEDNIAMLSYEATNNFLWYDQEVPGGTNRTRYFRFQDRSVFPYANFPTSGTNSLITSRMDLGFRRVKKSMSALLVETRNLTASTYIDVYYSLDGGSWILWQKITTNGIIELKYPGGEQTKEFNYVQFKFNFVTTVATETPILEGYTMLFIMRPETRMGYNFNVVAATNYQHGKSEDERDAADILTELKALRDSVAPIRMEDIQGVVRYGYVTAIQERPVYRRVETGGDDYDIEYSYSVNFVEVF